MSATKAARAQLTVELAIRIVLLVAVVLVHPFSYDVHGYWRRMHSLSWHHLPYRAFLWEFPPLTIAVVAPARWLSEATFSAVFALEMVACEFGSLVLLRRRFPQSADAVSRYWYAVALPLALQAWWRLDFLSVVLATWALVLIADRRSSAGAITLGLLAKLWPAVLVGAVVWQRRYRHTLVTVACVAVAVAAWFAFSPSGFGDFLRFRHGSGFEIDSIPGVLGVAAGSRISNVSDSYVVHAGQLGWVDPMLIAAWAGGAAACLVVGWRRPVRAVPLIGGLVIGLMLFSRILSPQYLVWGLPFAALAWAEGDRVPARLFAGAAWITAILNFGYQSFVDASPVAVGLVLIRDAVLVGAGVAFVCAGLARAPVGEAVPSRRRW